MILELDFSRIDVSEYPMRRKFGQIACQFETRAPTTPRGGEATGKSSLKALKSCLVKRFSEFSYLA